MLLKRSVEVLVGAALVVALMLAVLPAVAEAKEGPKAATHEEEAEAQSAKRGADATHAAHAVVVVRPGDSLWSISEEHLGPNATAQRIDRKTERIYALNRERIGADPNLILVGQELLVPSVGESSVGESSASSTTGSPAEDEATRRGQTTRAQERATEERATEANKAGQAPEQASEQAPGQAPERVTLPDVAAAQPVPAARPPISDPISEPTSNGSSSPTLAVALVAWALLTVVVFLVLWALRARGRKREARKMRNLRAVFGTNYTRFDPFDPLSGSVLSGLEETPSWRPPPASEAEETADNDPDRLGLLATTRLRRARIQHGRATRGGRPPGGRRTTTGGVYNPDIRRHLRGAPSARRTRRRRR
jgi:membrane protein implicated in regulation of membrane protease activity